METWERSIETEIPEYQSRVRWALEEAGLPYEERLITLGDEQKSERYRKLQPFGQVPALETEGLAIFESGAIVMHIAERMKAEKN